MVDKTTRTNARRDRQKSINIAEYLQRVKQLGEDNRVQERETIPLSEARGRVLAEAVTAETNIPGFSNSAMDGYAVQSDDLNEIPARLRIVGEQPAGLSKNSVVGAGQAVAIMTGAPVPQGADTVVQSELTEEEDGSVTVNEAVARGANIRRPGEDARVGQEILGAGIALGGRQLAAIAAVGQGTVRVYKKLTIGIVSTGDELAAPGSSLEPGQIYESNSVMLAGLVEEFGAQTLTRRAVTDKPEDLAEVLDELTSNCDAILLTGGVSVGKFDVVRNLLDGQAGAHFQRVALQPGKPQGNAIWNGTPVLAFPGNPVGAFVSYHVFGRPFLRQLTGQVFPPSPRRRAESGAAWTTPAGRTQYVPGTLKLSSAGAVVFERTSKYGSGSHLASTLGRATALAIIPAEVEAVQVGDILDVEDI